MNEQAQSEFERSLTAELGSLAGEIRPASAGSAAVAGWRLPDADRRALTTLGIPIFGPEPGPIPVQLQGDVQTEVDPAFREHGVDGYRLGTYWQRTVVAQPHEGSVLGVWSRFEPYVSCINSSVAAFVEISWRWCAASDALRLLGTEDEDYVQLYDNLARFKQLVHAVDPAVANDKRFGFWNGVCNSW